MRLACEHPNIVLRGVNSFEVDQRIEELYVGRVELRLHGLEEGGVLRNTTGRGEGRNGGNVRGDALETWEVMTGGSRNNRWGLAITGGVSQ